MHLSRLVFFFQNIKTGACNIKCNHITVYIFIECEHRQFLMYPALFCAAVLKIRSNIVHLKKKKKSAQLSQRTHSINANSAIWIAPCFWVSVFAENVNVKMNLIPLEIMFSFCFILFIFYLQAKPCLAGHRNLWPLGTRF